MDNNNLSIIVENYIDNDLNVEFLNEGWLGGILGFIFGGELAGVLGASVGSIGSAYLGAKSPGVILSSLIGGAVAGVVSATVLGHKIEEWIRYKKRVKLTGCSTVKDKKQRAACVLKGLKSIVEELKRESKKLNVGSKEWRVVNRKINRYEKDIAKLEKKVKEKFKQEQI